VEYVTDEDDAEAISDVLSISRDKLATTTMITVALGYQFITVCKQTIIIIINFT